MSRIRPLLYLSVAAVMMVGAACGSSSSSGTSGGGNSTPAFSPTTPATSSGGAVGGGDFCAKGKADATELQTKLAGIAGAAGTTEGLKQEMQTLLQLYSKALSEAPAEIKPDLQTMYDFVNTINSTLSAKNYDPTALMAIAPKIQAEEAKLTTAAKNIEAWAKTNCGA
jgi:hypothetical protein